MLSNAVLQRTLGKSRTAFRGYAALQKLPELLRTMKWQSRAERQDNEGPRMMPQPSWLAVKRGELTSRGKRLDWSRSQHTNRRLDMCDSPRRARRFLCAFAAAAMMLVVPTFGQGVKDKIKDAAERAKEKVRETSDKIKEAVRESERQCVDCGKVIHGRDRCATCEARRLKEGLKQTTERAKETAQSLKNDWREHKAQLASQTAEALDRTRQSLDRLRTDPSAQQELLRKFRSTAIDVGVLTLRSVPVLDPETGDLIPFDAMARKMAKDCGVGGDLGADPVKTGFLIVFDSDYLFTSARLIETPSGEYLTLNEAMLSVKQLPGWLDQRELTHATDANNRIRGALASNDSNALQVATRDFTEALSRLRGNRSVLQDRHVVVWASIDNSLTLAIALFEDSYKGLFRCFKGLGADADVARWLASGSMVVICLLLFLFLGWIVRTGPRRRLSEARARIRELGGNENDRQEEISRRRTC